MAITVLLVAFCLIGTAIIGCGEETEDPLTLEGTSGVLGVLKTPDTAPGAPQLIPEGTPTVKSVGYYSDWQLTKKLTGSVSPGKTIFIKVEFSEGMKLVVADDKNARPILYYRMGKELTRFRIAGFGAKGEDFVSGDAKPIKTQATFICKYTVQPEDAGEFVAAIGKLSVDREGNTLPAFYTHKEKLQLGITNPSIKSVNYYSDWQLKKPIAGAVAPGATVYVKIVFSEPMQVKAADDTSARPILYYQLNGRRTRFRIKQGGGLKSGDAKVWGESNDDVFVARYNIPKSAEGTFTIAVGKWTSDKDGNTLAAFYTHRERLRVQAPTAPKAEDTPNDTVDPRPTVSIKYYFHWSTRNPLLAVSPEGATIFVRITFSEPAQTKVAKGNAARPALYYQFNGKRVRANIVKIGGDALAPGEAYSLGAGNTVFIGKYALPKNVEGEFSVAIGEDTVSVAGSTFRVTDSPPLSVINPRDQDPEPPVRTPDPPAIGPAPTFTQAQIERYRDISNRLNTEVYQKLGKRRADGFRPLMHDLIAEEFNISFKVGYRARMGGLERKYYDNQEEGQKRVHAALMEMINIMLLNPDASEEEIFRLYEESVKNGTVEGIYNRLDPKYHSYFN